MGVSILPKPHPAARCWPISSVGCPLGNRIPVMFTSSAPYTSVDVSDFPEVHWVQKKRSNSIQMFKSIDLKICASSSRLPTCCNFLQLLTHRSLLSRFGGPSLPPGRPDHLHGLDGGLSWRAMSPAPVKTSLYHRAVAEMLVRNKPSTPPFPFKWSLEAQQFLWNESSTVNNTKCQPLADENQDWTQRDWGAAHCKPPSCRLWCGCGCIFFLDCALVLLLI